MKFIKFLMAVAALAAAVYVFLNKTELGRSILTLGRNNVCPLVKEYICEGKKLLVGEKKEEGPQGVDML